MAAQAGVQFTVQDKRILVKAVARTTQAAAAHPDEVVANVWNWGSQWKVEWFENGVRQGAMRQQTGLNPLAVQL